MPIKRVPLHRSGTCMLVTFSGTHTTRLRVREFISLSIIPQMFALISSWWRDFGTPSFTQKINKQINKANTGKVKKCWPLNLNIQRRRNNIDWVLYRRCLCYILIDSHTNKLTSQTTKSHFYSSLGFQVGVVCVCVVSFLNGVLISVRL